MKIGDKILCKKYLKFEMRENRSLSTQSFFYKETKSFRIFNKNKFYIINKLTTQYVYIYDEFSQLGLWFSFSEFEPFPNIWKYFYTEKEEKIQIRKMKINKINHENWR